jgi:hypothetical protein
MNGALEAGKPFEIAAGAVSSALNRLIEEALGRDWADTPGMEKSQLVSLTGNLRRAIELARSLNASKVQTAFKHFRDQIVRMQSVRQAAFRPPKGQGISDKTPLLPWIIADTILDRTRTPLENRRQIADQFAAKAEQMYATDPAFARRVNGPGNSGRDYLYRVMGEWLHAYLH